MLLKLVSAAPILLSLFPCYSNMKSFCSTSPLTVQVACKQEINEVKFNYLSCLALNFNQGSKLDNSSAGNFDQIEENESG